MQQAVSSCFKSAPGMLVSCIWKGQDEVPMSYIVECSNYHVNRAFIIKLSVSISSPPPSMLLLKCTGFFFLMVVHPGKINLLALPG